MGFAKSLWSTYKEELLLYKGSHYVGFVKPLQSSYTEELCYGSFMQSLDCIRDFAKPHSKAPRLYQGFCCGGFMMPLQSSYREKVCHKRGFTMEASQSPCKAPIERSFAIEGALLWGLCKAPRGFMKPLWNSYREGLLYILGSNMPPEAFALVLQSSEPKCQLLPGLWTYIGCMMFFFGRAILMWLPANQHGIVSSMC